MPAKSEAQRKAMYAAAAGKSTLGIPKKVGKEFIGASDKQKIKGAGIMLITPDDEVLFLLRSPGSNHPNEWDFPGGKADDNETPEDTAKRECAEEIGSYPYGELSQIAETTSQDDSGGDVEFITYRQFIRHKFTPKLDPQEHTAYKWAKLENAPEPLHPGVRDVVDAALGVIDGQAHDSAPLSGIAFDRASVRTVDQDGRMRVEISHISKAMICPYMGAEIPDYEKLGLSAEKIYMLFRDPDELKKSVSTWNSLPLLNEHIAVSASDHKPDAIVGATGTDASFNDPYLDNSLVIWTSEAIKGIDTGSQQEISCGYYYTPDMTPGNFEGQAYDGVMRNIIGNHVALVPKGRAGPDVVIGDSIPNFNGATMNKPLSKRAVLAKGALLAFLKPTMMAADSAINLDGILQGVKRKNWLDKKPGIIAAMKPLIAKDADLKDIVALLDKLDGATPDDDNLGQDNDDPKCEAILSKLRGKISDEDLSEVESMLKAPDAKPAAQDEPAQTSNAANANPKDSKNKEMIPGEPAAKNEDEEDMVTPAAMDAALKRVAKDTEAKTIAKLRGIAEAEEAVRPYVGKLTAQDSGDAVFKAALSAMGIDTKDMHPSAYRHVLNAQPKPNEVKKSSIAQDSASASVVMECFPDLMRK